METVNKVIIIDNQATVDYLESLSYEVNSRKDLLNYMIQSGASPSSEAFQEYHDEYRRFFVQYEEAKSQLEQEYVRPLGEGLRWNLDFKSRRLTIYGVPE